MTERTVEGRLSKLEANLDNLIKTTNFYYADLKQHMEEEKVWSSKLIRDHERLGGVMTGVAMAVSTIWGVGIAVFAWVKG